MSTRRTYLEAVAAREAWKREHWTSEAWKREHWTRTGGLLGAWDSEESRARYQALCREEERAQVTEMEQTAAEHADYLDDPADG